MPTCHAWIDAVAARLKDASSFYPGTREPKSLAELAERDRQERAYYEQLAADAKRMKPFDFSASIRQGIANANANAQVILTGSGAELDTIQKRYAGETDADFRQRLIEKWPASCGAKPAESREEFELRTRGYSLKTVPATPEQSAARFGGTVIVSIAGWGAIDIRGFDVGDEIDLPPSLQGPIRDTDRPGIAAMAAKNAQPTPEPVLSLAGEQATAAEFAQALQLVRAKNAPPVKETPRGLLCVREGFDHRLGAWGR